MPDSEQKLPLSNGSPFPLGTSKSETGINFAVFAEAAELVTLVLTSPEGIVTEIPLKPVVNQMGDVWHVCIEKKGLGLESWSYYYLVTNEGDETKHLLIDPYAKALTGPVAWGVVEPFTPDDEKALLSHPQGVVLPKRDFDWGEDKHPRVAPEKLIIYEMHVRSFTQHSSSGATHKGTFKGLIEKIPHLLDLGINAVELLPVTYFNECEYENQNPDGERLYNYWGYSPFAFFALMNRYATSNETIITEFKEMVKALHQAGIEVILDLVYNHTAEGGEFGPTLSFKGFSRNSYYITNTEGELADYTGCGNTINANHPVTRELILDSLRYFVAELHVDGFRFDLASCLTRGQHGDLLNMPPVIEAMALDPLMIGTKLIVEAWDATGLYQVGQFPHFGRVAEWNGRFRDTTRRFIKSDDNQTGDFATRVCGSPDMYSYGRKPFHSINFVTCHDGFSLWDMVSYNEKHNETNGEDNCDGNNSNDSWNCGTEGSTDDANILSLRNRQMRNFHVALMVSQGVPMLLMGDEYGHTKNGNNNTWCQDNELNWFLWDELDKNKEFYRFYKLLIQFRKRNPLLMRNRFLSDKDIVWHGAVAGKPDWTPPSRFIAFMLKDTIHQELGDKRPLYVAFNASWEEVTVQLPIVPLRLWHRIADSSLPSPDDIVDEANAPAIKTRTYKMAPYSTIILLAF